VKRYSPRPFERWVHGLNGKHGMWMYDPAKKEFWLGRMEGHQIYVEESSWYSEGGEESYGGGFHRWSKRYKELTLQGPHEADKLLIKVEACRAFSAKGYSWPAGRIAHLTPV
jgi:competence protein CoiA